MIRIGLLAALIAAAAAVYAQPKSGEAVPTPLPESRTEAPGELKDTPPRPAKNETRARGDADARHCLDMPTNAQVHRCAERYRTHAKRAGGTVKAAKKDKGGAPAKGNVLDIPKTAGAPAATSTAASPPEPKAAK